MNYTFDLQSGRLRLSVEGSDYSLDELCTFGSRRNRNRGFVIISKVLGKHIPVRPSRMDEIHRALAEKIRDLPGPIVFMALAETATGLGQAVYEAWLKQSSRDDVVFIHSTRYNLSYPVALTFSETHSHAPDHLVYYPINSNVLYDFLNARSLVLVDDELTTGRTLVNLASDYLYLNSGVQNILFVCLTDWLGPRREALFDKLDRQGSIISLLRGSLVFYPDPNFCPPDAPNVNLRPDKKDGLLTMNFGRLGLRGPVADSIVNQALVQIEPSSPSRLLVLGSGEFTHLPFRLAQKLESRGHQVYFQSTTRSPLWIGDAIHDVLEFEDNYGDQMPNYLYNSRSVSVDTVVIGYETANVPQTHNLPQQLGARAVIFGS